MVKLSVTLIMQIPRRKSELFKKRDDGPVYLTESGLEHLREKLAHLKRKLPEFIDDAQQAAALGDRSDSSEYREAKSLLRRTHRQILSIEDQIKRAVIIQSGPNSSGTIQLGSKVVLELGGERKTFEIVGPQETDPARGRISLKSPLGETLLGRKSGDIFQFRSQDCRILEVF